MRILAVGLAILMPLLLVEVAVRVRQYFRYGTTRPEIAVLHYDPTSGLSVPLPGQMSKNIWINSLGFRSPELVNPKPKGTIRLAFIGASTTFCAEVSSNDATWPHLVWKAAQEHWPGVRFDYLNAAVAGFGTLQSITNLESRVKPQQPDVIVIYGEAPNDLSKDSRDAAAQQGLIRGNVDDFGWFSRVSLTWSLVQKNLQVWQRQRNTTSAHAQHLVFEPAVLSRRFYEHQLELVTKAKQIAPIVVLPTFSQRLRRGQSPELQLRSANTHLYYMPHMTLDGLLVAFEEYNRVIRAVAEKTGALLVEGEDSIPADDRHFADSVHFRDAGAVVMARRVNEALFNDDTLKKLVNTQR